MLLDQATLAGIADGSIAAVYRRWLRPRVKLGSTFRTSIGVLSVIGVEPTTLAAISERAARRAGQPSRAALLAELARYREGRQTFVPEEVQRDRSVAKFWLRPVALASAGGFAGHELRQLHRLVEQNVKHFEEAWHAFFSA